MKLSKIARNINSTITEVVKFLQLNGYEFDENPNEEIAEEIVEFILYNFPSYLADQKGAKHTKSEAIKYEKSSSTIVDIPLEIKIIEASSKEKKLIERIIGFTDFNWNYTIAKYNGACSQPVDFNLFDEVICDLLLINEMSANKIGKILGLDIIQDSAEKEVLARAIKDLKSDGMIEGDDSIMWLTVQGKEYAKNGVKFSTYKRDFELYIDNVGNLLENGKNVLSRLTSEKLTSTFKEYPIELTKIQNLAEHQAQEIHFPKKNFILKEAIFKDAQSFKSKVWVILLENFRENTMRTLVYDEKQNKIITPLSEAIDSREDIKALLLSKIISNEDTTEIDFTFEEKNEFQITVEKELIEKQDEIDLAVDSHDIVKIREIEKEIVKSKRNFNSLEFELELKRLFDETADELWIISPWIKKATMKRIPFFENYLKKGGKIFIVYSQPEAEDQLMALEEPLNKLLELEKNYQNFYIHQLPPFHYKNVWLRMKDRNNFYYTGSYNILSFFVMQGLKHIRQEKMTRIDWNNETEDEYNEVFKKFGLKYITKAIDDFNSISQDNFNKVDKEIIQRIKNIDNGKLRPFINKGIAEFDRAYNELEISKNNNLDSYRRYFFNQIIIDYQKRVGELKKDLISPEKKRRLLSDFDKERADNMDFVDLQLGVVKDLILQINNLKTYNLHKSVIKKNIKK